MLGVEAMLTSVEAGDLGLERRERSGRLCGPVSGLALSSGQSADFGGRGLSPAPERIDLSGKPCQSFPPISSCTDERGEATLLTALRVLACGPMCRGLL
jgi:hypothetical protein